MTVLALASFFTLSTVLENDSGEEDFTSTPSARLSTVLMTMPCSQRLVPASRLALAFPAYLTNLPKNNEITEVKSKRIHNLPTCQENTMK
jgi:hypothetical protein